MRKGISWRIQWTELDQTLGLHEFQVIEFLMPDQSHLDVYVKAVDLYNEKDIYWHNTLFCLGDHPEYVAAKMESLKDVLVRLKIRRFSAHWGTRVTSKGIFPNMLPIIPGSREDNYARQNLALLAKTYGLEVIPENISVNLRKSDTIKAYYEGWSRVAIEHNLKLLLDLTNMKISSLASHTDFGSLFMLIKPEDVEYIHIAGVGRLGTYYVDSHEGFPLEKDILAEAQRFSGPVVFEIDTHLADHEKCLSLIERFKQL